MKKLICLTMLIIVSETFAQIVFPPIGCGDNIIYHDNSFNRSATALITDNPLTPLVLNVAFTMINDAPNHNNANLTTNEAIEDKFLFLIKLLNTNYNQHNIFFKYTGFKVVENAVISTGNYQYILFPGILNPPYIENNVAQYKVENAMNIYCMNEVTNASGGAYTASDILYLKNIMLTDANITNNTLKNVLIHEMGHCLSLYHTFEAQSHFIQTHPLFQFTQCEHLTREENNARYNADIAGDEVADTPATPLTNSLMFEPNCGAYIYNVNRHDCDSPVSSPYENILIGNVMNYGSHECDYSFTAGQVKRMREFIINGTYFYGGVESTPSNSNGNILEKINTVESLFQPYKQTIIVGDVIVSTNDNGNGTLSICKNRLVEHKFQPGFDYIFPDNLSPDPATATVDTIPITIMHTADYPVTIQQLAPGQTNLLTNTGTATLDCTRGVICHDEPFIYGTKSSAQNLLDINVTVEQLNELQVNDPELYNNLLEHYYYKLKKETATGAKVEQVFYKQ